MGCGAGAMTESDFFHIRLEIRPAIGSQEDLYARFRGAMTALIGDRLVSWDDDGSVGIVSVTMSGPIDTLQEAKQFNEAFNAILRGMRLAPPRAPGSGPTPGSHSFKVDQQIQTSSAIAPPPGDPNWKGPDVGP
jgi:hypothetical protein